VKPVENVAAWLPVNLATLDMDAEYAHFVVERLPDVHDEPLLANFRQDMHALIDRNVAIFRGEVEP
jgi:hypothetical protein